MIRTLLLLWRLTLPSMRRQPSQVAPGMRSDPAPSLWSYRYQRLMLTPAFRRAVRWGLPVAVGLGAGAVWVADPGHRLQVRQAWEAALDQVRERPEFMVGSLAVAGADEALGRAIRELLPLRFPVSSFDLDLEAMRAEVKTLTAVREARVGVQPGGVLEVRVDQRVPVAVWRYTDGLRLIDADGVMTGMIGSRAARADLPLIAGDGARDAIDEALALFAAAAPIGPRVRGLVRMGERRWDMVLDRDQRILLPTEGAVAALERVVALQDAQELLDRDVTVVDMRIEARPTVRLGQPALNVLRNPYIVSPDDAAPAAPILEEN